jgi:DnaD/phage-associated family protein
MINSVENAAFVAKLAHGSAQPPKMLWIENVPPQIKLDRPTVFRLYEQNIGPLTPLLAERLIRAMELYPVEWIEAAISEAVAYNRRNWRYIVRILENWTADGPPGNMGR